MANKSKQRVRALMVKTGMSYQAALNQIRRPDTQAKVPELAGLSSGDDRLFFREFGGEIVGSDFRRLQVAGRIVDQSYEVETPHGTVRVPAKEILRDRRGEVAVLGAGVFNLLRGFRLKVECEYEPPLVEGDEASCAGSLQIVKEGMLREMLTTHLGDRGILVHPPEESYSVWFTSGGTVEGAQLRP